MSPRRYQRTRNVSADIPVDAIYVGRPTKWGNPYTVEEYGQGVAVEMFYDALWGDGLEISVEEIQAELRGKDLVCWCTLDQRCHADVLLDVANDSLRVIVTGGRDFTDDAMIRREFQALAETCIYDDQYHPPTIVHGDAPGLDKRAARIALEFGMIPEAHAADWEGPCRETCRSGHRRKRYDGTDYCPAAGNYRNQDMVDLKADLTMRFPGGRGTADCAERAAAAGIEVYEVDG